LASISGPVTGATVGYAYDELGRLKNRTLPGQSETWTYDALGRVGPVIDPLGTFNYSYVGATGRLDNISRSGGLTTTFGYQPLAQDFALASITSRRPDNSVVGAQSYVQDQLRGLITGWDQTAPDGSVAQWDYHYTDGDELETARRSAAGLTVDYAYRYDGGGNRVSEQVGSTLRRWQVNGRNQLETEEAGGWLRVDAQFNAAPQSNRAFLNGREVAVDSSNHRIDALTPLNPGDQTLTLRAQDAATNAVLSKSWQVTVPDFAPKHYVYDGNGNLSRIEQGGVIVRFYRWDARNRLVAWGSGTDVEGRFEYDSSGQRIRELTASGAAVRQWVWAGGTQPLQERDGSGTVTRRYFSEGEMRRISGQDVARYYVRDHLGSVRAVTDPSNNVVSSYAFAPYGQRVKLSGSEDYEIAYTGHYFHQTTGLSLTLFRAYDSDTGRWLSRDPIQEQGGINLYGYVENNPINWIDPLGLAGLAAPHNQAALAELVASNSMIAGTMSSTATDVAATGLATAGASCALATAGEALDRLTTGLADLIYPPKEYPPFERPSVCEASRGTGERNIAGKDPNPWKGYRPRDSKDPKKGGEKRDPQTGKWKPVPRPQGPPPPDHPDW
jgi:RHS repeat-associated protein